MADSCSLILTNSEDATADYLCHRLGGAGIDFVRLDTDASLSSLGLSLQDGDLSLSIGGRRLRAQEIGALVYRRPKPFHAPVDGDDYQRRHASNEWAEAVEGFLAHVPPSKWLNHPVRSFQASHKVHQLTRAQGCGLRVPPWIVTTDAEEAEGFLNAHGTGVVAKPLASGFIERDDAVDDSLIYTCAVDDSHLALFDRLPGCPVLFQARVVKEVDVRMVIVDDQTVAVSLRATGEDGSQRLDIRRDNMRNVQYELVAVPAHVELAVKELMQEYGLRFGALDFAIDSAGEWMFFEVNPNGQWAWLDLAGACDIGALFIDALRRPREA